METAGFMSNYVLFTRFRVRLMPGDEKLVKIIDFRPLKTVKIPQGKCLVFIYHLCYDFICLFLLSYADSFITVNFNKSCRISANRRGDCYEFSFKRKFFTNFIVINNSFQSVDTSYYYYYYY